MEGALTLARGGSWEEGRATWDKTHMARSASGRKCGDSIAFAANQNWEGALVIPF